MYYVNNREDKETLVCDEVLWAGFLSYRNKNKSRERSDANQDELLEEKLRTQRLQNELLELKIKQLKSQG